MSQYLHFRNNPGLFSTVLVVCVVCILFFPVTRSSGAEFSPAGTVAGGNFCAGSEIGSIMAGLNLGATGQTDDGAMGLLLNLLADHHIEEDLMLLVLLFRQEYPISFLYQLMYIDSYYHAHDTLHWLN